MMGPIIEKGGSDIAGANAAAADLGISCERRSRALTWSDSGGSGESAAVTGSS